MKQFTYYLVFFCALFFSHLSYANWALSAETPIQISQVALDIEAKIDDLPQKHFFTAQEYAQVKRLLARTLHQQSLHKEQLDLFLTFYKKQPNDKNWQQVEKIHQSLDSINKSKETLLTLADNELRDQLTGFGPYGVTQFKTEFNLTQLNIDYYLNHQIRNVTLFIKDIKISPIPLISVVFKLFFFVIIFKWWMKNNERLINHFKGDEDKKPSLIVRSLWFLKRSKNVISYSLFSIVILRTISTLPGLQQLVFLEIFTWWVLAGSVAISLVYDFIYRNSRDNNDHIAALRLSTLRQYIWCTVITGIILHISSLTLGEATIYAWISSFFYVVFFLLTLIILKRWKTITFDNIPTTNIDSVPLIIQWSVKHQNTFFLSIAATFFSAIWLTQRFILQYFISVFSQYALFNHALAYLFRIEVAKQTEISKENANIVRIRGDETFQYILPGAEDSELIEEYASDEIKALSPYLSSDNPALCVISGERGIGMTTLLNRILSKTKKAITVYLNCPYDGYSALIPLLAQQLGLAENSTEKDILQLLRHSEERYLIAFDNAQRLAKPKVGGLTELIKLTNLLRRTRKNHRVLLAIDKSSWRFIDRARGERLLFDLVTFMPKWTEKQIAKLLDSRVAVCNNEPCLSFDGLTLPKQWDEEQITEEERTKYGFYRILWDYSDGNPTVALRFFRQSLHRNKDTDSVVVRLFKAPFSDDLEKMPKPMLAVLRSIVQLEVASPVDLCDCSRLSMAEVLSTLRYFQSRGYIEWMDEKARISDHWFRHITNTLHRQHLLVK